MTIEQERDHTRNRLDYLSEISNRMAGFNLRALMGAQSVFDLLDFGTYRQLRWASTNLRAGTNLFTSRDAISKTQERELHVSLAGPGAEGGRVEFEFERDNNSYKYEIAVKIRNAEAGTTHSFLVDGVNLGNVTINSTGIGRLYLSSNPSAGELPFTGGIPDVQLGSKIQIGNILEAVVGGHDDSTDYTIFRGEVETDLFGSSGARGSAKFEVEPEHGGLKTEFRARVRDTTPRQSLNVFVNDINVGQIVVDEDGRGELELSSEPSFDELPLPPNFPEITAGTTVRIGELVSGSFDQLPNIGPNGQGTSCDERHLESGFTGIAGIRGGTRFEVQLEDGGFLEHKFRVHLRDATPGETHEIRVAGISVGSITIDDRGRGQVDLSNRMRRDQDLPLPDFFPAMAAGTVVEVGDQLVAMMRDFSTRCGPPSLFADRSSGLNLIDNHRHEIGLVAQ